MKKRIELINGTEKRIFNADAFIGVKMDWNGDGWFLGFIYPRGCLEMIQLGNGDSDEKEDQLKAVYKQAEYFMFGVTDKTKMIINGESTEKVVKPNVAYISIHVCEEGNTNDHKINDKNIKCVTNLETRVYEVAVPFGEEYAPYLNETLEGIALNKFKKEFGKDVEIEDSYVDHVEEGEVETTYITCDFV